MKNKRFVCVLTGTVLLVAALMVLVCWQLSISSAQKKSVFYADTILSLIPDPIDSVAQERQNNEMPVLPIGGTDFSGVIEMPRFTSLLPVCADWGMITKHPCILNGSIYDGTLKVGATSQKGQYDFYREISVGDEVFFTNTEGNRYQYKVTSLRYEKHADAESLVKEDAALTLFIKNIHAFEYLIVFCN